MMIYWMRFKHSHRLPSLISRPQLYITKENVSVYGNNNFHNFSGKLIFHGRIGKQPNKTSAEPRHTQLTRYSVVGRVRGTRGGVSYRTCVMIYKGYFQSRVMERIDNINKSDKNTMVTIITNK